MASLLPRVLSILPDGYGLNRALALHAVALPLRDVPLLRLRELRNLIRHHPLLRVIFMVDGLTKRPAVLL